MTLQEYLRQFRRISAHRSYRRLLAGGAVSALGDRIGYIAFLGAVASHSSDALAIGGITMAEMTPPLFAAPVVSMIVDRYDRRRLMLVADLLRAALFAMAAFYSEMWVIYGTAFLAAGLMVLFDPARQALEPHYVPEGELTQANGIRQGMMSLVMICGPAIGGVLVATVGFRAAFLVNAASFLVSAWMVSGLDAVPVERKAHESAWQEILGGYRIVSRSSNLKFLFAMFAVFSLVIGIQFPLIYVFVAQNLHGGPREIGWLFSAIGVGGIVGGAWLASLDKQRNPFDAATVRGKQMIAALIALDGMVVVAFANLHDLLPVAALYTLFGFIGTSLHASVTAAIASQSPDHMRGRVFALYSALSGPLIVLSIALGTPFARTYGATSIFYVSGAGEVVLAGIAALLAARKTLARTRRVSALAQ